ncbi:MAG TPA: hypothetical protein VGE40_00865 [Bacilli bacterium]
MSNIRKLHPNIARDLKKFMSEHNITTKRLILDLEKETVEDVDDYSVDDILSVAGILKPGEANQLIEHIKESREGWGK